MNDSVTMHPVTTILGERARANRTDYTRCMDREAIGAMLRACRAPTKPTLAEIYAYASACGATARLDVFRE